ncbi:MAG: endolytic transglycosylase MltG [Agathobacter sp.]|nr:endolytic transglycosylase MltG [Agathobacter sp.]
MNVNKAVLKFVKLGITMILALLVIYATVSVSLTGFDFGYRVFTEPAMEEEPGHNVSITIDASMGGSEIGKELESKGLVRNASLFQIQLMLSAYAEDILPGTYVLNTSMTAKEMMMVMSTPQETEDESDDSETDTK